MCLEIIKDFPVKLNKQGVGIGWKVFRLIEGKLRGEYYFKKTLPINRWLREEDFRIDVYENRKILYSDRCNSTYPLGWHIYATRKEARRITENVRSFTDSKKASARICKVKFKYVVATGIQHIKKVIVAKEILITNIKGN